MKALEYALQAGVPVLVWGPPGVGKTATVQHLGKRLNLPVETVIASIHEPSDFNGLPVVQDGSVEFAPPAWAVRLAEAGKGILFLDEISNAPPAVQSALLRVILERVVGTLKLPDGVAIIAAANPPDIAADGWELSPPLANRFLHLEYRLDPQDWISHFPAYWGDPPRIDIEESHWSKARGLVASFIAARPALLLAPPRGETQGSYSWPSPRSWDAASRTLGLAFQLGIPVEEMTTLIRGAVGEGPALEFMTWFREVDLPDPEQLLADPDSFVMPDRGDRQLAVLLSVATAAANRLTPERWRAAWKILARAADQAVDIAIPAARVLAQKMSTQLPVPVQEVSRFVPTLRRIGILPGG